jgi:hypothetical protein
MLNSGAPASKEFDFYFREREGNAFGSMVLVSIDSLNFAGGTIDQIIGNVLGGVEHGEAQFQHCDTATLVSA